MSKKDNIISIEAHIRENQTNHITSIIPPSTSDKASVNSLDLNSLCITCRNIDFGKIINVFLFLLILEQGQMGLIYFRQFRQMNCPVNILVVRVKSIKSSLTPQSCFNSYSWRQIILQITEKYTDLLLSIKEVSTLLGVSTSFLYHLPDKELKRVRFGRAIRYRKSDVIAYIERNISV